MSAFIWKAILDNLRCLYQFIVLFSVICVSATEAETQITEGNSNILDTGRGRLIPTTATDQYFAELALWLGISRSDLSTILPNIGNFFDTSSSNSRLPINMLNI